MSNYYLNQCNYPNLANLRIIRTGQGTEENENKDLSCQSGTYFIGATRSISYLASKFGSIKEEYGVPWHWQNPKYVDLEKYSTNNPPLFGFVTNFQNWVYSDFTREGQRPTSVDQKCLSTYSRYNLVKNDSIVTKPDQTALGRNTKLVKDYYQDILSENINELTGEVVKWREYGWWPYILSPLSISFWIGGCGEPCYVCSYKGHSCIGNGEHALNLVIYALDQYWLTDKAAKNELFPSEKFLTDYNGTIVRGPEPTIGWQNYLVSKTATCSYCGCIIFCILVACIDPWFMRYSVVSSIFDFNSSDGIPQRLPGKFIEYTESIKQQLGQDDIEKKSILWDHFAQDRLFIDGEVDYYTAQIFNRGGLNNPPSGYLLGSQLDPKNLGGKIEGQDYIYIENDEKFAYATRTNSSGFYIEDGIASGTVSGQAKDSIFFGFRTNGVADDAGYLIRNVAVKHYNHNVRKDIFKYNWLYVDIPKPLKAEVTPAITSFDSFGMPALYFEDTNPLTIMRKNVFCKTILKSGDIVLNGNGSRRLNVDQYFNLFDGIAESEKYYPFLWIDRIEKKSIKTPYNLYFKSGDNEFKECLLGEMLNDLTPGRYYFPNPYACAAQRKTSPYDGNLHGGVIGRDYWVDDFNNHQNYFSTDLPMQFLGMTGENFLKDTSGNFAKDSDGKNIKDYKKMLELAKKILGNPESGSFAITSQNNNDFYVSGPIEEFPTLSVSGINNVPIIDWSDPNIGWYKEPSKFDRLRMLNDQMDQFMIDLRNYDQKWWSGYIF